MSTSRSTFSRSRAIRSSHTSDEYVGVRFPNCQSDSNRTAVSASFLRESFVGGSTGGMSSALMESRTAWYIASTTASVRSFSLASRRCNESMVRRNSATVCSRSASPLRATVALALAVTVHGLSGRGVVPVPGLQRGGDSRTGQHRFGKRLFQFVCDFGVRLEELCYAAQRASLVRPGDSSGFVCERQWVPPLLR